MKISDIHNRILDPFRKGTVIPAMPLALNPDRSFDELHQKALIRYYIDAGVGGIAAGVHSTQFEIRDPGIALFEPVLKFCSELIDDWCDKREVSLIKIAGICGRTQQAEKEAIFAVDQGYHAGLVSLGVFRDDEIQDLVTHCRRISQIIPVIGFYLQPAAGGRILPFSFWSSFAEIDNILAVKIAPFNRYRTIDVIRAVCEAGRDNEIVLYTGNDDSIVLDLIAEYRFFADQEDKRVRIRGGLLGQWAVWTRTAVELLKEIQGIVDSQSPVPGELLTRAMQITDCNAAIFDAANGFKGCIPGIHEILVRQGLFSGNTCLNPEEKLSPGQSREIDRIYRAYPHLNDDDFVNKHLERWLTG